MKWITSVWNLYGCVITKVSRTIHFCFLNGFSWYDKLLDPHQSPKCNFPRPLSPPPLPPSGTWCMFSSLKLHPLEYFEVWESKLKDTLGNTLFYKQPFYKQPGLRANNLMQLWRLRYHLLLKNGIDYAFVHCFLVKFTKIHGILSNFEPLNSQGWKNLKLLIKEV